MKKILIFLITILGSHFYTYSQIHICIEDPHNDFRKVAIMLTNKFDNEVILMTYSPLLSENRNIGIKFDFKDDANIISTWTYPFQVVGRKFYTTFPISSQETIHIEPDLSDISMRLKDKIKSIDVSIVFLIANPTTKECYKAQDSFELNRGKNKLERDMILYPMLQR